MKTKNSSLLTLLVVLLVNCAAFADRSLDKAEILQIFQQLTTQPRRTWITAGSIEAIHEEYKAPTTINTDEIKSIINQKITEYQNNPKKQELSATLQKMKLDAIPFNVRHELSNEYKMSSTVIVKFDGDRFYWEINVNSRDDSVKPSIDMVNNFMTEEFNLNWNARRIFAWDGENYTTYFLPGNHAIVDSTGRTPHIVNGPLTAGLVPWGYGYYSYDNLTAADSTAIEKYVDGQAQVHLSLNNPDGPYMSFVLDPAKGYAVIFCEITRAANSTISKQYFNYQFVSGNWIPTIILLEKKEAGTYKLLTRDLWEITRIDSSVPSVDSFSIDYEDDALIEHKSFITDKPTMYRYSESIDTEQLLADRLFFAANEGMQRQNCATAALKYAVSRLGKKVTNQQLAEIVAGADNHTNLWAMKQFIQSMGLYCQAVTTDINTLKDLEDCEVILHIPGKKHFVVLESIDENYVRIIDLASNKFYYHTDIDFFWMDWEGTALIISSNAIKGEFTEINNIQLDSIVGASGYSCTKLVQEYHVILCTYVGGQCEGYYRIYETRYVCESAESGSCSMSVMIRYRKKTCIENPEYPDQCTVTGEWICYYMRACT